MGNSTSQFLCASKIQAKKKPIKPNLSQTNGKVSKPFSINSASQQKVDNSVQKATKEEYILHPDYLHNYCSEEQQDLNISWLHVMENHDDGQDQTINDNDLYIGPMRISKPQYKALLVFSKNDKECQSWCDALDHLEFTYDIQHTEDLAVASFKKHQHHLIVIEYKCKSIDTDSLCKSLRGTYIGTFTTIVAVMCRRYRTNHSSSVKLPCFLSCDFYRRNQVSEAMSTNTLLHKGFDRLINDSSTVEEIEDEMLQLQSGLLSLQLKFRSCQAVFAALERSRDMIQIADGNFKLQFVNKAYEQATGFTSKQVIGLDLSLYFDDERNEDNIWERIKEEIKTGKEWEGCLHTKRKSNDEIQTNVHILPLTYQDGSVQQYVIISRAPSTSSLTDLSMLMGIKRKNSYEVHRKNSGAAEQLQIRRLSAASLFDGSDVHRRTNSLAKIHSMAIEAPITQIINLISIVKDSSQPSVGEVLDQILDILRNSELYSPADLPNRSRDPMLSDFVEGLVTGSGFSHRRASGGTGENLLGKTPPGSVSKTGFPKNPLSGGLNADPQIAMCLENLNSWDYDVLALERVTMKKPLVHLGMQTLNDFNVCDVLNCSQTTLHSWLVEIESKYHASNPYHNSTHAADVLHATAYFLKKERLKTWMEPLDEVAALLAAIIHDVDHPGRTNAFLVNSNSPLALLYNDTAVLESHHAAFAFKFTVNSDTCNIFKHMSKDNFRNIRQSMIDMVLATELSKHFEHVNKFISIVTKNNNNSSPLEQEGASSSNNRTSGGTNPAITHELKTLIKRVMIKVADVINPARKTPLCVEWARRISEEYFSQTDEEKRLGLPVVMPHFDRNTCSMPKSQMTFIDYFLTDMFEAWHEFCGMDDVMKTLNKNYKYWQKLHDRGIMRLAELEDEFVSEDDEEPVAPDSTASDEVTFNTDLRLENHLS